MNKYISLTFDDALDCHLDVVIPILNEYGLKGTFYIPLSAGVVGSGQSSLIGDHASEWREASRKGHELGNHSVFHAAVAEKKWVPKGYSLEEYSVSRMILELKVANSLLKAIDGKDERTYAFPCSNSCVGHDGIAGKLLNLFRLNRTRMKSWVDKASLDFGNTKEDFTDELGQLFYACRTGGFDDFSRISPSPGKSLRYRIPSVSIHGVKFDEIRNFTKQCLEPGGWLVWQFHGVGGGHHLNCDLEVFKQYVQYLSEHHREQVVTLLDGAKAYFGQA